MLWSDFFCSVKQLVDKVGACHAFSRDYEGVPPADPPGDRPEAMRPRVWLPDRQTQQGESHISTISISALMQWCSNKMLNYEMISTHEELCAIVTPVFTQI